MKSTGLQVIGAISVAKRKLSLIIKMMYRKFQRLRTRVLSAITPIPCPSGIPITSFPSDMYLFLFIIGLTIGSIYLAWLSGLFSYTRVNHDQDCNCGADKPIAPEPADFDWRKHINTETRELFVPSPSGKPAVIETLPPSLNKEEELKRAVHNFWVADLMKQTPEEAEFDAHVAAKMAEWEATKDPIAEREKIRQLRLNSTREKQNEQLKALGLFVEDPQQK